MAYSNQTTHYGLPLPVGSDKSTWLDTNEAFEAIDSAVYTAAQTASSQAEAISTLQGQMVTANANITANATAISTEATTREAQDTAHSTAISNINTKLGNTSMVGHGDGTVTGILMDLVTGYDDFVSGHTPTTITITPVSNTNLSVSTMDLIVDDYLYTLNINATFSGEVAKVASAVPEAYEIRLGTISAQQMSEHFAGLTPDTYYELGRLYASRASMGYGASSGEISGLLLNSVLRISLYVHNGIGYLVMATGSNSGSIYPKAVSTTTIGRYNDTASNVGFAGLITRLKKLTYHVPDAE